jgi:hypothetical protein
MPRAVQPSNNWKPLELADLRQIASRRSVRGNRTVTTGGDAWQHLVAITQIAALSALFTPPFTRRVPCSATAIELPPQSRSRQ